MTGIAPPVERAVESLRRAFRGSTVDVEPDGLGGAIVVVHQVLIGDRYTPPKTWFGFHISNAYPHADVYPHFIGRIERRDGSAHGSAVQQVDWHGRPALQLSRRSNGWRPGRDDAVLKAQKVLAWMAEQ